MNKYPVYIVSKGRWDIPYTADMFMDEGIDFKIVVEPQEYDNYCKSIPEENILKLSFKNLGKGSYPARNFCWEHSISEGHEKHWVFDDNIRGFRRLHQGNRYRLSAELAFKYAEEFTDRYTNVYISGFNYKYLISPYEKKPFKVNCHVYSALLIKNDIPYRWRLKYNEDVDLCLQVLDDGYCTILFQAFLIDKISTAEKLKGGNQTELYQGNDPKLKYKKAQTLKRTWPQYVRVTERYGRPHHFVDWKQFDHRLKRDPSIDWEELERQGNKKLTLKKLG